jgi:hypothetical protein
MNPRLFWALFASLIVVFAGLIIADLVQADSAGTKTVGAKFIVGIVGLLLAIGTLPIYLG